MAERLSGPVRGRYDTVFLDVWPTIGAANLPEAERLRALAERHFASGGEVLIWGYGWMLRLLEDARHRLQAVPPEARPAWLAAQSPAARTLLTPGGWDGPAPGAEQPLRTSAAVMPPSVVSPSAHQKRGIANGGRRARGRLCYRPVNDHRVLDWLRAEWAQPFHRVPTPPTPEPRRPIPDPLTSIRASRQRCWRPVQRPELRRSPGPFTLLAIGPHPARPESAGGGADRAASGPDDGAGNDHHPRQHEHLAEAAATLDGGHRCGVVPDGE